MNRPVALLIISLITLNLHPQGNKRTNSNVDILSYTFGISLSDSSDTIRGNATVVATMVREADSLKLDLKKTDQSGRGMTVSAVRLNDLAAGWSHISDKLSVCLPASVTTNQVFTLSVEYCGVPADGLIISETKFGKRSFFADHWPDRAHNYLPCIDHVSDKAAVEFVITAPDHYTVIANGTKREERILPGSLKLSRWKEETPIPVKVMTFGAAGFAFEQSGSFAGVPVWSYVYPENREEGFSDYAVALKPLEFYVRLLGPYPFGKLANVQSRTRFGGLENAGCIFYSENSVTGTGRSEGLIAHEIAHQWFGNSVTESDWHHIWLSEGFATYLTSMYWESQQGADRLKADMKSARDRVLRFAAQNPAPVIDTTVTDLMRLLNANQYQKGAWVLHMLRNEIGDKAFREGLIRYYSTFRDSSASTNDFVRIMEKAAHRDLNWFFHQWLYVAGQPDLKIDWVYNETDASVTITVSQLQNYIYSFPLEVEIKGEEGSTTTKLEITGRQTQAVISSPGRPAAVIPDPDTNLLFTLYQK